MHSHLINMLELHLLPIYFHQKTNGNGKPPTNEEKIYSYHNSLSSKKLFADSKPSYQPARAALTVYIINRRQMAMDSLEGIRDKSIPTTIPCPDSKPSHQRARAALTFFIINRRQMAMGSLQ